MVWALRHSVDVDILGCRDSCDIAWAVIAMVQNFTVCRIEHTYANGDDHRHACSMMALMAECMILRVWIGTVRIAAWCESASTSEAAKLSPWTPGMSWETFPQQTP